MDFHVPEAFNCVSTCYACEYLEDGTSLVVLCTTSRQLLQFKDKKVIGSIDLNLDADEILVFTSYNPLQRYYLVRGQQVVLVVKKSAPLCVIKTLRDVVQVQIQDRLGLGWPQAVIYTLGSEEPLITDFVSHLSPSDPQPVPALTLGLNAKLQELNERLVNASKLLQEKRTARVQALYELTPQLSPPQTTSQVERKVVAWGPPFPLRDTVVPPPLRLHPSWHRVHNARWVLGFPVFNTSHTDVESVRLRLISDSGTDLIYQTRLYVLPRHDTSGDQGPWVELAEHTPLFIAQATVPPRTAGVVLGVMEEPEFRSKAEVTISGNLLYKHSSLPDKSFHEVFSSPVAFKVEDLIKGKLRPFSSKDTNGMSDLLGCVAASEEHCLDVHSKHGLSVRLDLQELSLSEVSSQCWVGETSGSLGGVLVIHRQISASYHQLDVYARDTKQVLQLVHSLSPQWRVQVRSDSAATAGDCVKSLAAELRYLLTTLQPGASFSPDQWTEIRARLNDLELATDSAFQSYKQGTSDC